MQRAHAERGTFERALLGGRLADRLGYAFASGYTEALVALVPALLGRRASLCVTEIGPPHPRSIASTLDGLTLRGDKSFVTLGTSAETLLVLVKRGERDGRPDLALVRVDLPREGVTLCDRPALPFCPELTHATARFDVAIEPDETLVGDGWTDYVKPFRTIEDLHVVAAATGFLSRFVDVERLVALAERASAMNASTPEMHVALQDAFDALDETVSAARLGSDRDQARLLRDQALLKVAQKARAIRTRSARAALAKRGGPST